MRKYLIACSLIVASAAPALAAQDYYVALKHGGGCLVMTTKPDKSKYKTMGKYSSEADAKKAMSGMTECN
jgi:hypothetical protein